MKVQVRLYGIPRQVIGVKDLEIELPPGATVRTLMEELLKRAGEKARAQLVDGRRGGYNAVFHVNGKPATPEAMIADADEVVIMSPIAGG